MADDATRGREGVSGPEPAESDVIESRRLESFSDGVMAVIITLMALELRPPASEHWSAIAHRLPALLIYILSFTVIGIYWNNHHLLRVTRSISSGVMWSNLMLLFWLSLVPVTTQWVGGAYRDHLPAAAYGVVSLGSALAYFVLVRSILRANHHDRRLVRAVGYDVKGVISPILYAIGAGLALISPYLAYGCFLAVTMLWVVPDRRLTSRTPHRH